MTAQRRVTIIALGGTIAMEQAAPGEHAAPGSPAPVGPAGSPAADSPVPGVEVTRVQVANVGSPSLRFEHVRAALIAAEDAVGAGADGVVLTHGTDTLEETAFLLSRLWTHEESLVITGAMRPANAAGADGPANLRDAVLTATAESARGLGVLAVFDSHLHLGDRVTKTSSRSVTAFDSVPSGPIGVVHAEDVRLVYRPTDALLRLLAGTAARDLPEALPSVPIIGTGLGDDTTMLDLIAASVGAGPTGADDGPGAGSAQPMAGAAQPLAGPARPVAGVVINAAGMGHVPAGHMDPIRSLISAGVPVVVSTRIPEGGTSTYHYAYPGSEVDLMDAGAVMAGALSAHKARLLLQMLLADAAQGPSAPAAPAGSAAPAAPAGLPTLADLRAAFDVFSYE